MENNKSNKKFDFSQFGGRLVREPGGTDKKFDFSELGCRCKSCAPKKAAKGEAK